jgi:interferon-induced GTP-binding protein Mx1
VEQLRGRELPGFMSSQAFYMCMAQYVDAWEKPMLDLIKQIQDVALEVSIKLADILFSAYPNLREMMKSINEKILESLTHKSVERMHDLLFREKDPFTLNEFLQQWVNKLRFDRFTKAVELTFDHANSAPSNWGALKEEIFVSMRSWYRETHAISALASAQEMNAIMEAYWNLSAKRFVDNCCMISDKEILGVFPDLIQDEMYQFIRDDNRLQVSSYYMLCLLFCIIMLMPLCI